MKQIPTPKPTTPLFDIDWTKPVIEFDPWPFAQGRVRLKRNWYIKVNGQPVWRAEAGRPFVISKDFGNVLGTATDGNPFVTSPAGLAAWMAK